MNAGCSPLFIRQPYAELILRWIKTVEYRSRPTRVGERFHIYASDNDHEESDTTMKKSKTASKETKGEASPSQLTDARIKELADWRGETLARVRKLIKQADPEVVEAWKWRGVPVWEHNS